MTPKAKGGEAWDGEKDIGKSKAEFRVFKDSIVFITYKYTFYLFKIFIGV